MGAPAESPGQGGVSAHIAGMFYQAIVADICLYNSKMRVLSPSALKALEGFHVETDMWLKGMQPKRSEGV